jgi:sugar O-acyltransferase (sialic acid O-acetyltransferase NeuD family)
MKDLLIIGARGYGREVYNYALQCREYNTLWTIKGFLDDKSSALENYPGYPPIVGPVETYEIQSGDVNYKYKYAKIIKDKGGVFVSIIHPTAILFSNTEFGEGFIACPYTIISCNVKIGDFVSINSFSELGHDVQVGNYCHINTYSFLGGFVRMGDFSTIHTGAKIIEKVNIGSQTTIGVGSVVIKKVKDNCTVFGNPAKIIYDE